MTKLKRDVHSWAKRVRMSRTRVWALVEGSKNDVPFYEALLIAGSGNDRVEVIRASDIKVNEVSAGGKQQAVKIMQTLHETGELQQENKATKIDIVVFLDRDDDNYLGTLVENPHVIYTEHADVEAEIVAYSTLPVAVSETFSLSRTEARACTPAAPMHDLAGRWAEWIALRLAASEVKWGGARFSQSSSVNRPRYGSLEAEYFDSICSQISMERDDWEPALVRAREYVSDHLKSGQGSLLVKGKWMPEFVVSRVRAAAESSVKLEATHMHLLTACRMSIDFESVWRKYEGKLGPLLSR